MFLDWIANLGYIAHDKEAGILTSFPLTTRNMIASSVADFLLKDTTPITTLSTIAHVNHIMECVGQGFGLPINDGSTIKAITELYRRWLLEKIRPQPVEADEQRVFRMIFRHFSLLFAPRTDKDANIDLQAELCITILGVLETLGKMKDRLVKETWEELLHIMLGITDSLLKGGRGGVDQASPLGTKLCPHVLKALFELFLRSGTQNNELWNQLKELVQGWRHRMPVIMQWNATCAGLTNRVIRLSYGTEEGNDSVVILVNNTNTNIEMTDDHTFYCWYRMLYIIGDLETIIQHTNYLEAFQGIRTVVNTFLQIKEKPGSPAPPNGNTILNIFGSWLFKAINMKKKDNSFDYGISEAIATLCSIFTKKFKTQFLDEYYACFYRGLEESLQKSAYMMDMVLRNSKTLFQHELKGCRKLIPSYLKAIKSVLSQPKGKQIPGTVSPVSTLRSDCIAILGYMSGLSNAFSQTKFFGLTKEGLIGSYTEISGILDGEILLEALRTEDNVNNINMLFRLISVFIHENITVESPFPNLFVTLLLHQIMSPDVWANEVIYNALSVLGELATLYPLFKKDKNKETSLFLVTALCKYLDFEQSLSSKSPPSEDLIVASYHCVLKWIMQDQWLLKDRDTLNKVLDVIEIGMGWPPMKKPDEPGSSPAPAKPGHHPPTQKIMEAAEYVLINLLGRIDSFPGFLGPQAVSCPKNENFFLENLQLKAKNISCYIFDRTVLTVIKHSRVKEGKVPTMTLIARDITGKYVWTTQLVYPAVVEIETEAYSGTSKPVHSNPFEEQTTQLNEQDKKYYSNLVDLLDSAEKRRFEILSEKVPEREKQERQFLEKVNFGLNHDMYVVKPVQPPIDESNKSLSAPRLFLTHFGFLNLNNYLNFFPVQQFDAVQPFNFLENFKTLDNAREREFYHAAVLYYGASQKEEDILKNRSGSAEYQHFIENIGWMTDMHNHVGYNGGLDPKVTGEKAPYYATFDYEMIFHVGTLIPNVDQLAHKKALIQGNRVFVTWVEDYEKYDRSNLKFEIAFNILIIPLKSRLYRIKILREKDTKEKDEKSALQTFGPLLDEMVVSQKVLPSLVRETVLNASFSLRDNKQRQFTKRRELLDGFVGNYRVQDPVSNLFAAQLV